MNNIQYTDQQLQLTLTKMLPKVKEIEWLGLCGWIEETLNDDEYNMFNLYICEIIGGKLPIRSVSASWQQRALALSKVKGIKIV